MDASGHKLPITPLEAAVTARCMDLPAVQGPDGSADLLGRARGCTPRCISVLMGCAPETETLAATDDLATQLTWPGPLPE